MLQQTSVLDLSIIRQDYSFIVVHEVTKGYPIFQTKVLDSYPHLNGGQQLGALEACPLQPLHL